MDYIRHYNVLIHSRQNRGLKEGEYYEKHHIIPKCVGGTNINTNLVLLTAREHYIAHWLLTKIYKDEWKLYYAFYQMSKSNGRGRIISSKQFERSRTYLSKGMVLRHQDPNYFNPGRGEKSRKKASDRMKGPSNPGRGKIEDNYTARPYKVIFDDGTEMIFKYGKLGYETLGVSRSSWITATRTGISIPKFKIKQIIKLDKI